MPNGENSKLEQVIAKLKQISRTTKDNVIDYVRSPLDRVLSAFTRENVVNAVMPKFLARGVNRVFDMLSENKKNKNDKGSGNDEDVKDTETVVNSESDLSEADIDLLEELLDTMDSGFEETNKNLTQILMKIGGYQTNSYQGKPAPLLLGYSNQTDDPTTEVLETEYKVLEVTEDTNQALTDLLDINGTIVKTLQTIEKNTRVDTLKQREDELEARKQNVFQRFIESGRGSDKNGVGENKGGLMKGILNSILGFAGLKTVTGKIGGKLLLGGVSGAAGSILGSIKSAIGSSWQGAKSVGSTLLGKGSNGILGAVKGLASKVPTLGLLGAGTTVSAAPTLALPAPAVTSVVPATTLPAVSPAKVVGAIAPSATKGGLLQSVKGVGGKLLGAPLAIGAGAYEAYNVSQDTDLSSEQKTTEYSKIGGKTVGALAGAKAGATIGAIGGPIGAAIGGVVGGIGGYFLGEKGGEIVGDIINAISPSSRNATVDAKVSNKILAEKMNVIGISSKPSEDAILAAKTSVVGVSDIVNPRIGAITPGQTKTNTLQLLTQQIEQTNAEKQEMKASPTIVPITISNQNSTTNSSGSQDGSQRQRISVPVVRNQDGTIQRLLDLNYSPLLAT